MSMESPIAPPVRRVPAALKRRLHATALQADDLLDGARRRLNARLGRDQPRHIAAYRGHGDARGVELCGRVLAEEPRGGPEDDDGWWENLLATYRRFTTGKIPDAPVKLVFRDAQVHTESDREGYYSAELATASLPSELLWDNAIASLADGSLAVAQPVLQVAADAAFGVISDIDDTVLHSSIVDWKTAAQLTFLHNARTRKPLDGVAVLYQALQAGASGRSGHRRHPVFYVSSSPWNLYDLLDDFMELNAIPCGPIFLRDLGIDEDKFIKSAGHGHKLERAIALIERYPHLQWVLAGDSGQADAELYAEAAHAYPDRILATDHSAAARRMPRGTPTAAISTPRASCHQLKRQRGASRGHPAEQHQLRHRHRAGQVVPPHPPEPLVVPRQSGPMPPRCCRARPAGCGRSRRRSCASPRPRSAPSSAGPAAPRRAASSSGRCTGDPRIGARTTRCHRWCAAGTAHRRPVVAQAAPRNVEVGAVVAHARRARTCRSKRSGRTARRVRGSPAAGSRPAGRHSARAYRPARREIVTPTPVTP
jgi:phosphatidate phosphatase APP1